MKAKGKIPPNARLQRGEKNPLQKGTQKEARAEQVKPRRPNRAHGAIDKLPPEVQLLVKDLLLGRPEADIPRLTYGEIAEKLQELGHHISAKQVWRYFARIRNEIERVENARTRSEAIVRQLVTDDTTMEQATVGLVQALCMEALVDADPVQVQSVRDLANVAHSVGRLQSSQVMREKWRQEDGKRRREVMDQLKKEVMQELAGDPETTKKLLDHIDAAEASMQEKTA